MVRGPVPRMFQLIRAEAFKTKLRILSVIFLIQMSVKRAARADKGTRAHGMKLRYYSDTLSGSTPECSSLVP